MALGQQLIMLPLGEATCIVQKRHAELTDPFACTASYLWHQQRGLDSHNIDQGQHVRKERSSPETVPDVTFIPQAAAAKAEHKSCLTLTVQLLAAAAAAATDIALSILLPCPAGRRPYLKGLNLEKIGSEIKTDNRGRVEVNHKFQTSVPHIYAIGDVIPGPMLAHKVGLLRFSAGTDLQATI